MNINKQEYYAEFELYRKTIKIVGLSEEDVRLQLETLNKHTVNSDIEVKKIVPDATTSNQLIQFKNKIQDEFADCAIGNDEDGQNPHSILAMCIENASRDLLDEVREETFLSSLAEKKLKAIRDIIFV